MTGVGPLRATLRAAVVVAALAGPAALAQERPALFPTRDVTITYRTPGPDGLPMRSTISWLAAAQRVRFDGVGSGGYMLLDRRSGRGWHVVPADRRVTELPEESARRMLSNYDGRDFVRLGGDRVAGVDCTVWRFTVRDRTLTACLGSEGVVLRSQGGGMRPEDVVEAVAVTFGRQDPARFDPPAYPPPQAPSRPGRWN